MEPFATKSKGVGRKDRQKQGRKREGDKVNKIRKSPKRQVLLEMKFGEGTMARNGSDQKGKYEVQSMVQTHNHKSTIAKPETAKKVITLHSMLSLACHLQAYPPLFLSLTLSYPLPSYGRPNSSRWSHLTPFSPTPHRTLT